MGRKRTGSIFKRVNGKKITWWARLTFTDDATGKRRDLQRRAESQADARDVRDRLVEQYDIGGRSLMDAERMTFAELADYVKAHYCQEAQYDAEGRKLVGIRSVQTALLLVSTLVAYFGQTKIRDITVAHLVAFRAARLKTPTKYGKPRNVASVNRELAKLRMMLSVAVTCGWLVKSPFARAKAGSLISIADERQRERILSTDEERRLLVACDAPRRERLRALVISALDTGARRGELITLRWQDVDLEARTMHVTSYKGKTMQKRELYITTRMLIELEKLLAMKSKTDDMLGERLVYGISNNVESSWRAARKEAGLDGLRFHDLRHTAATRLVGAHIPLPEVGRVLGHSNPVTTYRYVNRTSEMVRRAGQVFESFQTESTGESPQASDVVH